MYASYTQYTRHDNIRVHTTQQQCTAHMGASAVEQHDCLWKETVTESAKSVVLNEYVCVCVFLCGWLGRWGYCSQQSVFGSGV